MSRELSMESCRVTLGAKKLVYYAVLEGILMYRAEKWPSNSFNVLNNPRILTSLGKSKSIVVCVKESHRV